MDQKLNPFPGLRPFEMQEKYLFFGREDQTVELLKRLNQARFMAVVGTSGSGKSSLVRAGLLPELHGGTMTDAGSSWEIAVMRPGGDPLTNLAKSLEDSGIYDTDEDGYYRHLRAMLGRSTMGLIEAVSQSELEKGDNLLIVVDQFEEIFRFRSSSGKHAEEATNFISLLLEATQQTEKSIFVTITMRSDFLGDCSQFRGLAEAVNEGEYLIPRLNRNQRRLAIEGPVKVGGKQIEARLVQQLLNDIGDDPDQLPILQHALMRTWEYHDKDGSMGALDLEHYEATGGMKEALSRHADEVFNELITDDERTYCERIFKALTERVSGGRGIRRPMAMAELAEVVGVDNPNKLLTVVEAFRSAGRTFLMPPDSIELGSNVVIDISHESLMRVWQRLVGWVDEESQSARIYRRLADTAQLYKENKAGLYRDPDLQISLSWRDQNNPTEAWADRYYPGYKSAMAFLEESYETSISEEKAKEEARKRELENARRLTEEERRSKSLWQKLVLTFGVAVIAITFGLIDIIKSRETINNSLSRASLKEANRLANSNKEDEAIALLAKTLEENPDYSEAGIRLMSILEHTAFPTEIRQVYSLPDDSKNRSDAYNLRVYPESNLIVEKSISENDIHSYRLVNLDSKKVFKEWKSKNQLSFGRILEEIKYFSYIEKDELNNSKIVFYDIKSNDTFFINELNNFQFRFFNEDNEIMLMQYGDSSFSIYSLKERKFIQEKINILEKGEDALNYAISPSGNIITILCGKKNSTKKIYVYDRTSRERRLLKTYPYDDTLRRRGRSISFVNENLLTVRMWGKGFNVCDLIDIKFKKITDLRGGVSSVSINPNLFNNGSFAVSGDAEGELAIARYPFGNFKRLEGHNGRVSVVKISNDGTILATGSDDKTVRLWSALQAEQISVPIRFKNAINDIVFSYAGDSLFVSAGGKIFKVKLPVVKSEQSSYELVSSQRYSSYYNPDNDKISLLSENGLTVIDFNSDQSKLIKLEETGIEMGVSGNKFYPHRVDWKSNEAFFINTNSKTNLYANIVDIDNGILKKKYKLPANIKFVNINNTFSSILTLSTNRTLSVFKAKTERVEVDNLITSISGIKTNNSEINSISLDDNYMFARFVGDDGLVQLRQLNSNKGAIYDIESAKKIELKLNYTPSMGGVKFYPKRNLYFVSSANHSYSYITKDKFNSIDIIDFGQNYQSHAVDKDETIVAISTEDGRVVIWNLDTLKVDGKVLKHKFEVEGIVFHPHDNRYIFTFMDGGYLYGWDRIEGNIFMGPIKINSGKNLYLNTSGRTLSAQSINDRIYRVPVQIPQNDLNFESWLPRLATSLIGFKLNDSLMYDSLNKSTFMESELSSMPKSKSIKNWISWVQRDNAIKTASPNGSSVFDDILSVLSDSENYRDLHKALLLKPSDPNILSDFAYYFLESSNLNEFNKRYSSFCISKAQEITNNSANVFYRSAQVEKILNNQVKALKCIDQAIELDSANNQYKDLRKSLLKNN